ncbi:hypothetical protein BDV96DRAFT_639053 [Lophiotrema nucula]|uniref:Myb-like domain-containing protein n=1 Tax=Lophiotrema nucula TaxID=690887 RepID=A0A6A5ZT87_9PLEO|nr:hypothetical protein BDV96DRAFT_639053 [Lophiotrema nucula]
MTPVPRPEPGEVQASANSSPLKASKSRTHYVVKHQKRNVLVSKSKGVKKTRTKLKDDNEWQQDETDTLIARTDKGDEIQDIAKAIKRTVLSCRKKLAAMRTALRKTWTHEQDIKLCEMYLDCKTEVDIRRVAFPNKSLSEVIKRRKYHTVRDTESGRDTPSELYTTMLFAHNPNLKK